MTKNLEFHADKTWRGTSSYQILRDEPNLFLQCRPRLDLEYPVYGAHELADEGAFTSVVVLTASFPSGFRRGQKLNPRPSLQSKLVVCNDLYSYMSNVVL